MHGPAGVTARAVATRAGVSNGTLYHYFPSIDALLLAVADRAASRQIGTFGDPVGGLGSVLRRLFDADRRDTVLPWLRLRAQTSPEVAAALQRYDHEVNSTYALALRSAGSDIGLRADVDVEAVVEVVRALAEALQLRAASNTLVVEADRFVDAALDAITTAWLAGTTAP